MNTPAGLVAPLVVAFTLISWAVLSLMRATEDDELIERLRHDADPAGDDLQDLLVTLRDSGEPGPYDAPTDPVLAAWDGGRS